MRSKPQEGSVNPMANYHLTVRMISRQGGKSCVAALAYRSATKLLDERIGQMWDYTNKPFVGHVEILVPESAPAWISDIASMCQSDRQSALQKFSDICEAAEKRKDSQVYREVEFSLPNELTNEQNIAWANAFVKSFFVQRGMVAVVNFHFDMDRETGVEKPHCHALLTTRDLTENGFGLKNRDWNSRELIDEAREQCAQYQNAALKAEGFDARVSHLSYADRNLDVDPQPKRSRNVQDMARRGIETDKKKIFDLVRLKNQFKIVKNPELVFSIVTSKHSTFTRKDIAKVLNRYIDDANQFRVLHDRLMGSRELVPLKPVSPESAPLKQKPEGLVNVPGEAHEGPEPVYTTRDMLKIELDLVNQAQAFAARVTHPVSSDIIQKVVSKYHKKFREHGGLSADQENAIRHMLSGEQMSCVVGFAGAGKTTCLEAVKEGWEEAGYSVLGLAPTGTAERNIAACGIRSMTIHKFLKSHEQGRERISDKTVVVIDEMGMVDSRRCFALESIIAKAGAKIVPLGDGNQLQSIEAGPAFRLLVDRVNPAILETVVRQKIDWQRDATRFFGKLETRKALSLYHSHGLIHTIAEEKVDLQDDAKVIDNYCLARQISGRIWSEMEEDEKKRTGQTRPAHEAPDFEALSRHQDYALHGHWKNLRHHFVQRIIDDFDIQKAALKDRGVDIQAFEQLVLDYMASQGEDREAFFEEIDNTLRNMSYGNIVDMRVNARQALVDAWAADRALNPAKSHLMLTFTNKDACKLNESARLFMREQGEITGPDFVYETQDIETDDFGVEHTTYHDRTFAQGDRILFTRNDKRLGVKNGTLGTIVALKKHNIKVALDEDREKTVSFAPKLYPFFDNGWATTTHKAQGATVDFVKVLAVYQDFRNLVYVAMTRHRENLKVYVSDLDFWREGKIFDRLARVQEKLSGLDYLNVDQIQNQLEEDTDILWHEQKIQQGKDFWAAVKVTARDIWGTVTPRSGEGAKKGGTETEGYLSFEDSEEKRSTDFFKEAPFSPAPEINGSQATDASGGGEAQGMGGTKEAEGRKGTKEAGKEKKGRGKGGTGGARQGTRRGTREEEGVATERPSHPKNPQPDSSVPSGTKADPKGDGTTLPLAVDLERCKNQSRIMKDPEIVLDIVTDKHSTFTKKDIARILNEHINDPNLFQVLYDRLANSKELVNLEGPVDQEAVFTTRKMLRIELDLMNQAQALASQKTHPVAPDIIEGVVARFHKKFDQFGGLSADQEKAIRHMLGGEQISCVVGFAGAGKTTCLEAVKEGWEEAGYSVLGLAPTGKAERSISECGIRSMTIHKFLKAQEKGEEVLTAKTVVIVDEAGMVDSRRFDKLQSLVAEAGAKIVPVGDNNQLQSIEAGPAFRLVCSKVEAAILETVVRQKIDWQRDATRFFGLSQPREALALYQKHGAFEILQESLPNPQNPDQLLDAFCLARQVSGRMWKEIAEDYKAKFGRAINFKEEGIFDVLSTHKDFELYTAWKERRKQAVEMIIQNFDSQKPKLERLGSVDVQKLEMLVSVYKATPVEQGEKIFGEIETVLRQMSYDNIFDTRMHTKQTLVSAWAAHVNAAPEDSHLILAFTNRDARTLNESARLLMREQERITGPNYMFATQYIQEDDFGDTTVLHEDCTFAQGDRILFTRNDEKLGVKNGSLGTILSLDSETITVILDGKEQKQLSFSPAAHPFIDNGWATTIHKAQSASINHVKKLASYEEYRNLAYVGMTRHTHSLKVYASDLDFWREEKIFDRLSRVQEKLSGFDYLDAAAIAEKLQTESIPSQPNHAEEREEDEQNEQGRASSQSERNDPSSSFWASLKTEFSSFFRPADKQASQESDPATTPESPAPKASPPNDHPKTDFLNERYLSLEDSEEKRSSDLFKDPSDTRGKEAFVKEDSPEAQGSQSYSSPDTKGPGLQEEREGKQEERQEGKPADEREESPEEEQERKPEEQQGSPPCPTAATANSPQSTAESAQQAKERSDQLLSSTAQNGEGGKRPSIPSPAPSLSPSSSPPSPSSALWSSSPSSSSSLSASPSSHRDDPFRENLKKIQEKINRDYAARIVVRENPLSFKEIEDRLRERIFDLATDIFGKPTSQAGESIRFGKNGSVCIFIRGNKQGMYTNFETDGKGKGPLKMIEEQMRLSSPAEARKWAMDWLGRSFQLQESGARADAYASAETGKQPVLKKNTTELKWRPIIPVPENVPAPDITGDKYLNGMLKGGKEVSRHAYRDEQGNLKGYVVRIEKTPMIQTDGSIKISKITPPLAYGKDARGFECWKWKAFFGKDNKTPYGIEKLAQDQDKHIGNSIGDSMDKLIANSLSKPVLVVEGEKTADAAQKLLPGYHVLTWIGGAGSVDKTNWGCLVGKTVSIWPDYDYDGGGQEAAQKLRKIITQLNKDAGKEGLVGIVNLPDHLRHGPERLKDGWDLGDNLPEGWTIDSVEKMIRGALPDLRQDKKTDMPNADTSSTDALDGGTPLRKEGSVPPDRRELFEKARLPINQEWCATLGFMMQHRRFPDTAEELNAAWWQGERLTAIEGRLYKEALEGKKKVDEKQLTIQARKELAKNQVAPGYILAFGKASDLAESQVKQLEQHVLMHQDRTGNIPASADLDALCRVIRMHSQVMGTDGINNKGTGHVPSDNWTSSQTQGALQEISQKIPEADTSDTYRILIEQQAVLGQMVNRSGAMDKIDQEGKIILKGGVLSATAPQAYEIRDSCSERLGRMNEKVLETKAFAQEMKALELSRQNQGGIEM
jgi:Ti-type conjugative transfer relaxase TraA